MYKNIIYKNFINNKQYVKLLFIFIFYLGSISGVEARQDLENRRNSEQIYDELVEGSSAPSSIQGKDNKNNAKVYDKLVEGKNSSEEDNNLYKKAFLEIKKGNFSTALEKFQALVDEYPYSDLADDATIMIAFLQFVLTEYDESLTSLETFIELNPLSDNIAYVYYLKALSLYYLTSDSLREQSFSLVAIEAFQELIARFPNSIYVDDANIKISKLKDKLVKHYIHIAFFYQQNKMYHSSIQRLTYLITNHPDNKYIPEAYLRIAESYYIMGIKDIAHSYINILNKNHPNFKYKTKMRF